MVHNLYTSALQAPEASTNRGTGSRGTEQVTERERLHVRGAHHALRHDASDWLLQ